MAVNEFKRQDGTKWFQIDFRNQAGRRVREFGGCTRTDAKNLLEQRRSEVRLGTYINPKDAKRQAAEELGPTFKEYAARFLREYGDQRQSRYYRMVLSDTAAIMRHFGEMRVKQIGAAEFDAFRSKRSKDGVSASTMRKNLTVLGTMFKYARRWGVIDVNPAADLEKPSEPRHKTRFLSREEWTRLEATAKPWLLPILTMAVATGMRLKEVVSLRWSDIDREAGIPDATFHTLRHTARSWMVQAGRPLAEVQKILGHSTPLMTQRYAHLQPEHLRDSMAALDAILRVGVDTYTDTGETRSA